jgi:PAS domain S-box-containing protein
MLDKKAIKSTSLRKRAEEALRNKTIEGKALTSEEARKLIHELSVYQIELEMQNENLRKSQIDLEESRDRYTDLYDFAPVGYFTLDKRGLILESNLTAAKMLGWERSLYIKKPFVHLVARGNRDSFYQCKIAVLEKKTRQTCELKLLRKDKTEFYADLELEVTEETLDDSVQLRMAVIDITERKQAEEALRKSEETFRSLFSTMSEGVVLITPDGQIEKANTSAERILGLKRSKIEGRNYTSPEWEIIRTDGTPMPPEEMAGPRAMKEMRPVMNVEMGVVHPDRSVSWVNVNASPLTNASGNLIGIVGTFADITERKAAEKRVKEYHNHLEEMVEKRTRELVKSEIRYKTLVEAQDDAIFILNLDGNVSFINKGGEKITGYSKDEIIGKNFTNFVAPEHRKKVIERFKMNLSNPSTSRYETQILIKDGRRVDLEVITIPLRESGELTSFQGIARDITQRKRAEEEVKRRLMKYSLDEGNLYLVKEYPPLLAIEGFNDLLTAGYKGIVFSRTPEVEIRKMIEKDFEFFWLSDAKDEKSHTLQAKNIKSVIEGLSWKCAVLIDRLDYIISKIGFENILSMIQQLRDRAYLDNHIFILSIDPSIISKKQLRLLEKETREIETRFTGKVSLDLLKFLKFIYLQNWKGVKPSYKDIGRKLELSQPTVRKKIRYLIGSGHVKESLKGNKKVVELTEKSMDLFLK